MSKLCNAEHIPFFSIIIPVFNAEKYLESCLESVLSQDYIDYEIVLVNDGSSDNSDEICLRYRNNYQKRIKYIKKRNEGQVLTRSCGVHNAQGEFLIFLDSDDELKPGALNVISSTIHKYNPDYLLFNASKNHDFSEAIFDYSPLPENLLLDKTKVIEILFEHNLYSLWTKSFRRNLFMPDEECNFIWKIKMGEDILTSLYSLIEAKRIILINQNLYFYRTNLNSVVHTYQPSRFSTFSTFINAVDRYVEIVELRNSIKTKKSIIDQYKCDKIIELIIYLSLNKKKAELVSLKRELSSYGWYKNVLKSPKTVRNYLILFLFNINFLGMISFICRFYLHISKFFNS